MTPDDAATRPTPQKSLCSAAQGRMRETGLEPRLADRKHRPTEHQHPSGAALGTFRAFRELDDRLNELYLRFRRRIGTMRWHRRTGPSLLRGIRRSDAAPDPVSLAVLAIDRVGPAAVRACALGVEIRVAAPDEVTAAVLRAALAKTAQHRCTDRLIRIVVN